MSVNVTTETLQLIAAICGDPTLTSIFRNCHTNSDLAKQWDTYSVTCEKLAKNWCERAGITADASVPSTAATGGVARSKDAILQDFIDSVRVVAAGLTIAELSAFLEDVNSGNDKVKEIKQEFRSRYSVNPEAALVYLKQKQVDILMAGNWV